MTQHKDCCKHSYVQRRIFVNNKNKLEIRTMLMHHELELAGRKLASEIKHIHTSANNILCTAFTELTFYISFGTKKVAPETGFPANLSAQL